uniref:Uncharacterized protein n=1 Tax=Ciona intestinalis TaxID=7719 RepID=H2XPP1_CIOIN
MANSWPICQKTQYAFGRLSNDINQHQNLTVSGRLCKDRRMRNYSHLKKSIDSLKMDLIHTCRHLDQNCQSIHHRFSLCNTTKTNCQSQVKNLINAVDVYNNLWMVQGSRLLVAHRKIHIERRHFDAKGKFNNIRCHYQALLVTEMKLIHFFKGVIESACGNTRSPDSGRT